MRKSLLVAGTATLAVGVSGIAVAQTPAPSIEVSASASPSKAGTKSKPRSHKLTLSVKNNVESKSTAKSIEISYPRTIKLSTSGLDECRASDDELIANVNVCRKSIAGKGEANALVNPFAAAPAALKFKVTPVVGRKELLFVLDSPIADAVLHGKIRGNKLTIAINPELQQPAPNTYSALVDLKTTLSKKKGSKALVASTGCRNKKATVKVKINYAPNPNPPATSSASDSDDIPCS